MYRVPAFSAHKNRIQSLSAALVHQPGYRSLHTPQMPVSPGLEEEKCRDQLTGRLTQYVIVTGWPFGVLYSFQHPGFDQCSKALGENIRRDSELALEIAKPPVAIHHAAENPERLPVADELDCRQDRTPDFV